MDFPPHGFMSHLGECDSLDGRVSTLYNPRRYIAVRRTHGIPIFLVALCAIVLSTALITYAADAEEGKKLYGQYCALCHGQSGKGDGPGAANLNPKPRDHTDKEYMSKLSDDDLLKVIKNGGASIGKSPLMPPWGGALKDDQIKDVIAYVRTLCCQ
jgi:cytochrome c oxidase cbb3-type subunit III